MADNSPHPLIFQLYVTFQKSGQLVTDALAGTGIRGDDAPLFSLLDRQGPLTPTDLARRLGVGPSTLTYRLKALEAQKLVVRRPNPADGRSALIELSPRGRRRWQTIVPAFTEALRGAERRVARPHDEVEAALEAISAALDEELAARSAARPRRAA